MRFLSQTVAQLRQLWSRLSRAQQISIAALGAGALIFALLLTRMGSSPTYVTAFTNLDPKDSSAAADELKAQKIPYVVTPDGATIKVTADHLADARMKLAAKGLPQGGAVGFELFDKTSFGVTDFVEHLNYQRALEGELTRTINTLEPVEASRVNIVVPKEALFTTDQKPATASVMLKLRPGRKLDASALQGVSHLIARSVEGLDEKNIAIVDSSGKMLFDGATTADGVGLTTTQLDMEKKLESGVESQVQSLLDQVTGPNRAAVRVQADMDFSQQESTSESYTPGGTDGQGAVRSTSSSKENFSGSGPAAQQAGVAANDPNVRSAAAGAAGGNSTYQKDDGTTNYEVNKNTQKTVQSPGRVKRLSVSVLLDASINQQDATGLRDAIAAAAGIDQKRGDQIVVTTAAFTKQGADTLTAPKPGLLDSVSSYGKLGIPLFAALLVLFFIWRMSRSVGGAQAGNSSVLVGGGGMPALQSGAARMAYSAALASGARGELEGGEQTLRLSEPLQTQETIDQIRRRKEIQDRMTDLAQANPAAMSEIIHSWMSQDDRKK